MDEYRMIFMDQWQDMMERIRDDRPFLPAMVHKDKESAILRHKIQREQTLLESHELNAKCLDEDSRNAAVHGDHRAAKALAHAAKQERELGEICRKILKTL